MAACGVWRELNLPAESRRRLDLIREVEGGSELLKAWLDDHGSTCGVIELLLDADPLALKKEIEHTLDKERRAVEIHASYRVPIQKLTLEQRLERAARHGLQNFGQARDSVFDANSLLLCKPKT